MGSEGCLYVCPTPIGNLEDVTLRVLRILKEVNVILAEDTRRTRKLLSHYQIPASVEAFHARNERVKTPGIIERLGKGQTAALVTDAGMPGLSDPGHLLLSACSESGMPIDVLPGASAVTTALIASTLPCGRFVFEGFLPRKGVERRRRLEEISIQQRATVFFEAPHRLVATLQELQQYVGLRRVAIARELSKLHQEMTLGTCGEVLEALLRRFPGGGVIGEISIVVEGVSDERGGGEEREESFMRAGDMVTELRRTGMSRKDAVTSAASRFGVPKNMLYESTLRRQD